MNKLPMATYLFINTSGNQVTMGGNTVINTHARTIMKKNGNEAWATNIELLPLMFCNTNKLKPTGGVTSAISTNNTMKMPNHTKSNPACCTMGSTMEVVNTIMETPSSAAPNNM